MRHVEIEDMAEPADVEAARRDVAAHQQPELARLELLERGETLRLGHVAMQRAGVEIVAGERLVEDIHVALAVAEDERVLHFLGPDQPAQRLALVVLGDQRERLGDGGGDARRAATP